MAIRLETSRRTGIANHQDAEISAYDRHWSDRIPKLYRNVIPRTDPSAAYNCHGLTFASRRTRVDNTSDVFRVIHDDNWVEIPMNGILPGDIVIYFSEEGDANHSGIVMEYRQLAVPLICSKWGNAGEYIHALQNCPPVYGPVTKFYRCRL